MIYHLHQLRKKREGNALDNSIIYLKSLIILICISLSKMSVAEATECHVYSTPKVHKEHFQVIVFQTNDGRLAAGIYNGKAQYHITIWARH